jgi:glycosyltransferase 2 family protein
LAEAMSSTVDAVEHDARNQSRKWLFLGLRVAAVLYLYAVLFRFVDLRKFLGHLSTSILPAVLFAALLILFQAAFCTFRWRRIAFARSRCIPGFWTSFRIYAENLFANQLLPSTLGGDVLRVMRWRSLGTDSATAAASVFLDRLSGINGAALVVVGALPFIGRYSDTWMNVVIAGALGLAVFASTAVGFALLRWPGLLRPIQRLPRLRRFAEVLRQKLSYDREFLFASVLSVAGHLLAALAAYIIARSLVIDVAFLALIAVSALGVLASAIPLSIGGWGIREFSFVAFLAPFGVPGDQALALSVLVGASLLLAALPGGLGIAFGRWNHPARLPE